MKLRNYEIEYLIKALDSMSLSGTKSRLRTRFQTQLETYYHTVLQPERNQLMMEYVERDEQDDPIFKDIERTQPLILKDEFYSEISSLLNEEYIVEVNDTNRLTLLNLCDILLDDCKLEFSGDLAKMYDNWCVQCEKIREQYNIDTIGE